MMGLNGHHDSLSVSLLFAVYRTLQDELRHDVLRVLPALLVPRSVLCGVRVCVEQPVARRICLGRFGPAV